MVLWLLIYHLLNGYQGLVLASTLLASPIAGEIAAANWFDVLEGVADLLVWGWGGLAFCCDGQAKQSLDVSTLTSHVYVPVVRTCTWGLSTFIFPFPSMCSDPVTMDRQLCVNTVSAMSHCWNMHWQEHGRPQVLGSYAGGLNTTRTQYNHVGPVFWYSMCCKQGREFHALVSRE